MLAQIVCVCVYLCKLFCFRNESSFSNKLGNILKKQTEPFKNKNFYIYKTNS